MPTNAIVPLTTVLSGVGIASVFYSASILAILRVPSIECHAVYMHRMKLTGGNDLNHPEQFGFAHCQATPFFIKTRDGEKLHAWHVLPIGLYQQNAKRLVTQDRNRGRDISKGLNFRLLKEDPEARLVIHTHGSSGALSAYCRTECYRSLSSTAPNKIHVLAFDYRGFGLSSGTPSEKGLIVDAQSVFRWATDVAGIAPERIVVFGQSMGSSVAIALARTLAVQKVSIAGLIITGSFPDVPTMLTEYRTFFGLRAFGLLAKFPSLKVFCTQGMRNQWPNLDRLVEVVRHSPAYHIEIFHAQDDPVVPWTLSNKFFEHAVGATKQKRMHQVEFNKEKESKTVLLGEGGWYVEWPTPNGVIRQEVPRYGVHDRIMMQPQIAMAVMRAFRSKDSAFAVDSKCVHSE
ncbi:alpha/beta-hydrolase [Decorospora gaudefroyi]|uniref:Alpha/beta-hydrolase n=1 Tax=Decorospora gaudefroyi TaxID=184978 RepID=A0A6A5KBP8_9PLEO|nr:alpha/beta-hydrolase [Decorospora gaudefroyi]